MLKWLFVSGNMLSRSLLVSDSVLSRTYDLFKIHNYPLKIIVSFVIIVVSISYSILDSILDYHYVEWYISIWLVLNFNSFEQIFKLLQHSICHKKGVIINFIDIFKLSDPRFHSKYLWLIIDNCWFFSTIISL